MLSRFYLTGAFKGITLFVLMSFMSSLWVGCSETKLTESGENTSSTARLIADEDAGTESPYRLVLGGLELQAMVNWALADPNCRSQADAVTGQGYYFDLPSSFGLIKDSAGIQQKMVLLAYGWPEDSTRVAYVVYSQDLNNGRAVEVGDLILGPVSAPAGGYEEVVDDVWLRTSVVYSAAAKVQVRAFLKCWLGAAGAWCLFCLRGCMSSGAGYGHCVAICCGVGALATGAICASRIL